MNKKWKKLIFQLLHEIKILVDFSWPALLKHEDLVPNYNAIITLIFIFYYGLHCFSVPTTPEQRKKTSSSLAEGGGESLGGGGGGRS